MADAAAATRAHHTILLTFAAFGSVVGTHVGSLPVLVTSSSISPMAFGIAGGIGMIANILAMSLGGRINRMADHRSVLLVTIPAIAAALAFALLVGSVWSFMLSFILLSFTLGMTDLFMNAEASVVEQELGRKVFTSYHAAASLAMAVFGIIGSLIAVMLAPAFAFLFSAVPLAIAWAAVAKHIPARALSHASEREKPVVLPRRILLLIGLAAGANVACEGAAMLWAGQLLTSIAPEYAAISGLGIAFYGLCSGAMRLAADRLRHRYGDLRVMSMCLTTAVAGFVVLGLAPGFWWSVLAFAAVGMGLGVIFPCLFALTGRIVPEARAAAMGYVAAVGGLPRITLPWLLGWIASMTSISGVFGICAFVALSALIIIVFSFNKAEQLVPAR
jgi:MFS family permease